MPIYEYACPDCGHKFDELQKFDDPPITVCPKCSADKVKKLISATSFVLKGGGWYSDHYGLKKGGDSGESSGASASAATGAATPVGGAAAPASSGGSSPAPASAPAAAPASSSGNSGSSSS